MNELTSILGIGAALCIGAASPGPSFIMVARAAASAGRVNGLNAALGMGLGFATQVSNPKTAIVYASVFAAFLPVAPSIPFNLAIITLVFVIEAGWYAVVAIALSSEAPRGTYLRYKKWVDRLAGAIMGALGVKLAASASQG